MSHVYHFNHHLDPSHAAFEPCDDVLHLLPPLGGTEVSRRLAAAPWLSRYIAWQWSGTDGDPYGEAFGATARIIVTAAALESRHPDDLAMALHLPAMFVRVALVALEAADWRAEVWPRLLELVGGPVDLDALKDFMDDFLISDFDVHVSLSDLQKALGPAL